MERAKVIRGLRIAWSVWCGILCVLLIVLWVRSYWWQDEIGFLFSNGQRLAQLQSQPGILTGELASADGDTFSLEHYARIFNTRRFREPTELSFTWIFREIPTCSVPYWPYPYATVPYWFLVTATAAAAGIPWIKRRWSFSLHTPDHDDVDRSHVGADCVVEPLASRATETGASALRLMCLTPNL